MSSRDTAAVNLAALYADPASGPELDLHAAAADQARAARGLAARYADLAPPGSYEHAAWTAVTVHLPAALAEVLRLHDERSRALTAAAGSTDTTVTSADRHREQLLRLLDAARAELAALPETHPLARLAAAVEVAAADTATLVGLLRDAAHHDGMRLLAHPAALVAS
jgi:hypothetical protein